jgi:hypothetical protein
VYISSRPVPAAFHPAYRKQIRRFSLLCTAATGALVASVIMDGILTALRVFGTAASASMLIPIFAMAIEIVCAGVLIFHIRRMMQRTAFTVALLGN